MAPGPDTVDSAGAVAAAGSVPAPPPAPARAPLRLLQLGLRWINPHETDVDWLFHNNATLQYKVNGEQLKDLADSLRVHLDRVVQGHITAPGTQATRDAMRALLRKGHALYEGLFDGLGNEAAVAAAARQRYETLAAAGPLALRLRVMPNLTFPWGLVVPDVRDLEAACADLTQPHDLFWSTRHDFAIAAYGLSGSWDEALQRAQVNIVAAMHRRIFDAARGATPLTAFECQWIDALAHRLHNRAYLFSVDTLRQALQDAAADDAVRLRIAYLLGHGNGKRFQLGSGDEILAAELASALNKSGGRSQRLPTLLFLNGCETAADAPQFSFADILGSADIGALVGTEVRVPDLFAFRFALALLYRVIVSGEPLAQAFAELRRSHLPVSLAYSLYATDGLMLEPHPAPELAVLPDTDRPRGNLSKEQLRCDL